jgi:hypothetical protein
LQVCRGRNPHVARITYELIQIGAPIAPGDELGARVLGARISSQTFGVSFFRVRRPARKFEDVSELQEWLRVVRLQLDRLSISLFGGVDKAELLLRVSILDPNSRKIRIDLQGGRVVERSARPVALPPGLIGLLNETQSVLALAARLAGEFNLRPFPHRLGLK